LQTANQRFDYIKMSISCSEMKRRGPILPKLTEEGFFKDEIFRRDFGGRLQQQPSNLHVSA
jgi:hypothetical protein